MLKNWFSFVNVSHVRLRLRGMRFFSSSVALLNTLLLVFIKKRVPARQLQAAAERTLAQMSVYSDSADPDAWIMINANFLSPLPRSCVNLWQARKLKNWLEKAIFTEPGEYERPEKKPAPVGVKKAAEAVNENASAVQNKRKKGLDAEKIMERVMLGWRVSEICKEQNCSESYVYKLIKKRKGNSAMDYRWKQWELIAGMYHAEPKMTVEEIEKACGVSRAVIYHAVKNSRS
ncbi:hypothetical protein ACQE3Z_19100 [Pantoea sp. FN0307]